MRPGLRRVSSVAVSDGTRLWRVRRIGAPNSAASAVPPSESAKLSSMTMTAAGTPGAKVPAEMAAAVAQREGSAADEGRAEAALIGRYGWDSLEED